MFGNDDGFYRRAAVRPTRAKTPYYELSLYFVVALFLPIANPFTLAHTKNTKKSSSPSSDPHNFRNNKTRGSNVNYYRGYQILPTTAVSSVNQTRGHFDNNAKALINQVQFTHHYKNQRRKDDSSYYNAAFASDDDKLTDRNHTPKPREDVEWKGL